MLQWLVSMAVVVELVAICLESRELSAVAGGMFVSAFLAGAGRLQGYARILLVIALLVLGGFAWRGSLDAGQLLKAASDAAFYSAFLGSLGLMQCLVRRFEVLRRIHDVLLGGKPILLYPKYALVSCGVATVTGRLLALILVVFTVMAGLVATTGFKVSVAAMLSVPTVTLLYMLWQERALMPVLKEGVGQVWAMQNEMAIFAASAILGVALSAVIPADALAGLVATGGGVFLVAVVGMLMMPMFSMIGIIPITVLSVQAGLLPQLVAEGMELLPVAVALVIGFSLAMMLSPFGPSVMLLARFGQISRWVVAFRWNGLFVLIALPVLLVLTALVAWLAPGLA